LTHRPALAIIVALSLAACTPATVDAGYYIVAPADPAPVETPAAPETPTATPEPPAAPIPEPIQEALMLKAIPVFPAYIRDQCNAIWGIPSDLQGEMHKVHITVETTDGDAVPQSELDLYTIDGVVYITHSRMVEGKTLLDTYRLESGRLILDDSAPSKPEEGRVVLDSPQWLIETVVINGVERSDIYLHGEVFGEKSTGKGFGPRTSSQVTAFVVLDNGLLYMTPNGAYFWPSNRTSIDAVSEYGRLWK
jgi:hypothetical protein